MNEYVRTDGTVVDQLGNFVGIDQPAAANLLGDLREWFGNEVEVGDTALAHWVERIDSVLGVAAQRER